MTYRLPFAIWLLGCVMLGGTANVFAMPSPVEAQDMPAAFGAMSGSTGLAQAQTAPAPAPPATPAPAATPTPAPAAAPSPTQAAPAEPIGNVATLTGAATVTRNNTSTPLKLQDDIYLNDVLQTSANSTLGITFNDATTFNLTANASITVDNYVYEDGGKQNPTVKYVRELDYTLLGKAQHVTDAVDISLVRPRPRKYETAGAASAVAQEKAAEEKKKAESATPAE